MHSNGRHLMRQPDAAVAAALGRRNELVAHSRSANSAEMLSFSGGPVLAKVTVETHGHETLDKFESDVAHVDITRLVGRAASGDTRAWEQLIDKHGKLVWSITREFKLNESDAADVFQTTWMRLVEHINRLDHPDRVGSWLAATARNECLRCLAARKRLAFALENVAFDGPAGQEPAVDEALLAGERAKIVREAMTHLPKRWQLLLELLMADPPASYAEISDELGLPIGSIGPTRSRCLAKLRVLLSAS
jgi:RNA polymerase sigma factor (sigma-70 family)